ncbi:MAG: phenylalanine--tRNA ligase subunit beta, partial [Halioglobus sp.]|nr:phenylalanine--tRNA ligase subunit beta [Halioglobus sp.]
MKFSESWLRQSVNPSISTADLVAQVTMAGLEVDAVEPAAPKISGVVVGEIISVEQHPDADKLRVCQVAGGSEGETTQVVCGAPNAR